MARTIQGIITKYNLLRQPIVVINKAGGAGGEGFLDVKSSRDNPHKIAIAGSNLFTTPIATGIPFNWKDLSPVAMLALDEFVLWVNAEQSFRSVKGFIDAAKAANGGIKIGGTGSKQEDQVITEAIQHATGAQFGLTQTIGTRLPALDFVALARGHGIEGIKISRPDELEGALGSLLAASHPTLIEVAVD